MAASFDAICRKQHTDKSSEHHDFCKFYEAHLPSDIDSLLEVGILNGESLKAWREWQPSARIVGMDISQPEQERLDHGCICRHVDQDSVMSLQNAIGTETFAVILDDGGHSMSQQLNTLYAYWPHVKPGGCFIVEDLHTSPDYSNQTMLGFIARAKREGHPLLSDLKATQCNFDIEGGEQNEHMTCILQKNLKV